MTAVDVVTEIEIERPRADVAAFAADPDNATAWHAGIKSVQWQTPKPAVEGSRIEFTTRFLGRTLEYTYEVIAVEPGERFVMRTDNGRVPMETAYTWEDCGVGRTRMTLRNRGMPSGFSKIAAPAIARAMQRADLKDLERLKALLEAA